MAGGDLVTKHNNSDGIDYTVNGERERWFNILCCHFYRQADIFLVGSLKWVIRKNQQQHMMPKAYLDYMKLGNCSSLVIPETRNNEITATFPGAANVNIYFRSWYLCNFIFF